MTKAEQEVRINSEMDRYDPTGGDEIMDDDHPGEAEGSSREYTHGVEGGGPVVGPVIIITGWRSRGALP